MKLSAAPASAISNVLRFDAKYHISRQNPILQQLRSGRWPSESVGGLFGQKNIWSGNIFSRVYATSIEHGKPLLVPYDLFRYVPWSTKILSRAQVDQFERLEIKRGWVFIVCSGRNLGPLTVADRFCEQFTMSHDMVRIAVDLSDELFYTAAFLSSAHGQASIRTDMNGSVIDHTNENLIASIQVPMVEQSLKDWCSRRFRRAFELREQARVLLSDTSLAFLRHFKLADEFACLTEVERSRRFSIARSALRYRFDAEPAAPAYTAWRERIRSAGGVRLGEIARVFKPASRYKTTYVDSHEHGVRMMNGRQIAQYRPIALRSMNLSSFKNASSFLIAAGMTLLTADGRAEENLADCALVTADRTNWAASGHVHRVVPHEGVPPGLVYLACACAPVQLQLKALATGSVVDALSESDVASVIVPFGTSPKVTSMGRAAEHAWELFAKASNAEDEAVGALEREFQGG